MPLDAADAYKNGYIKNMGYLEGLRTRITPAYTGHKFPKHLDVKTIIPADKRPEE